MTTIGETIDMAVPLETARKKWAEYTVGMVIGSGRGPGELEHPFRWRKTERDADEGAVQFATISEGITRLTVTLDYPEADERTAGPTVDQLRAFLLYDLELFREYAEGRLRLAS